MKQQQVAAAKLKVEQLSREEESFAHRADMLAKRQSRMEDLARVHGGVSEKTFKAKARAQEVQNKMIEGEDEVKRLNQEIRDDHNLLKATEDQLQAVKGKEEDYNNGARLAVLKSNKLERDLKDARIELESQKQNLTEMTEAAEVEEAKWDSARRLREQQEAANKAEAQLLESKQGQLGLLRQINPQDMSMVEKKLEETKLMLKAAKLKNKEAARAQAEALKQEQDRTKGKHEAAEAQLHKVEAALEHAREEQHAAVQNAHTRIQKNVVADEEVRTKEAERALQPLQRKLEDAEARLHQQMVANQVQAQDFAQRAADLQSHLKQDVSQTQSKEEDARKQLDQMKNDVKENLKEDLAKQSRMQHTMTEMKASQVQQRRKVEEIDANLRSERAKIEEASSRLQLFEKKRAAQELEYHNKMYEANVQKEEKAQEEVDRLQQEFRKVHNDKNERITQLSHKLHDLKQGKLRGA
mmetsp:Transcript_61058/g.136405  ORF Transcript_61058/g.136405 Transcript_61058/m.136405 type:complete len:469 (+) Transcript_61058:1-1407(+)